jgi:hypothetical protein
MVEPSHRDRRRPSGAPPWELNMSPPRFCQQIRLTGFADRSRLSPGLHRSSAMDHCCRVAFYGARIELEMRKSCQLHRNVF